jgi:hypothetical protein
LTASISRQEELDKTVVKLVKSMSKNLGFEDLKQGCQSTLHETKVFPWQQVQQSHESVQTSISDQRGGELSIDVSSISGGTVISSPPDMTDFLAGLGDEVEIENMSPVNAVSDTLIQCGGEVSSPYESAKPSTKHPISKEDLEDLVRRWCPSIGESLRFIQQPKDELQPESDILHGEFEKDLLLVDAPGKFKSILTQYKEVFGALPEPGSVKKEVSMDLQLKPEWEAVSLRVKCFPMSKADADEIERQVEELYAQIGRLNIQLAWLKKKSGLDPIER